MYNMLGVFMLHCGMRLKFTGHRGSVYGERANFTALVLSFRELRSQCDKKKLSNTDKYVFIIACRRNVLTTKKSFVLCPNINCDYQVLH